MAPDIRGMCPSLEVFDMATSLKFYCNILGFEIRATDQNTTAPDHNWVWLVRGEDIHLMLNTAYDPGHRPAKPDPRRVADHHDTHLYFGAPDVDAVYNYLQERGVQSEKPHVAWYGMKQLYLRDPDGYGLCFQWKAEKEVSSEPARTGT